MIAINVNIFIKLLTRDNLVLINFLLVVINIPLGRVAIYNTFHQIMLTLSATTFSVSPEDTILASTFSLLCACLANLALP